MRWRFADAAVPQELQHKHQTIAKIRAWWTQFAASTAQIDAAFLRRGEFDVVDFMRQHLNSIESRICWEYGAGIKQTGHRLVITPESHRELRPMIDTLLQMAPALPGWEFYPYRVPESVEMAYQSAEARCRVKVESAEVRASRGKGNRIDVIFRSPSFAALTQDQARHAAMVLTETLLGEELLDKWVGVIDVEARPAGGPPPLPPGMVRPVPPPPPGAPPRATPPPPPGAAPRATPPPPPGARFLPLDRLGPTFNAVIQSIRDQMPARPLYQLNLTDEQNVKWMSFQLEPERQEEYAGQGDLMIGSSCQMETTRSALGPSFCSERFSRFGETFAYLKLDRAGVPQQQWVEWRAAFEDALDPVLKSDAAGCIYANGTGLKYSYIELALADVQKSTALIRRTLRRLQAPARSWLLFHDPELAEEWAGVWDQTPAPPMAGA